MDGLPLELKERERRYQAKVNHTKGISFFYGTILGSFAGFAITLGYTSGLAKDAENLSREILKLEEIFQREKDAGISISEYLSANSHLRTGIDNLDLITLTADQSPEQNAILKTEYTESLAELLGQPVSIAPLAKSVSEETRAIYQEVRDSNKHIREVAEGRLER